MEDPENKIENEEEEEEEESDDEEEEVIVYANFEEGSIDKDIFQRPDVKFKVIGLESDSPIVQLGDTTFRGTWNDTIGTKVIFEEDPLPDQVDPVFTVLPQKMLKLKCMATKCLDLSRIFLKPKEEDNNLQDISDMSPSNDLNDSEEQDVLELTNITVNPDLCTDEVMRSIAEESVVDLYD